MIYSVKELLERNDVKAAIQGDNLDYVYQLCVDERFMPSILTNKLLANNINPLEYVNCVYPDMYYESNIKEITIPAYIAQIKKEAFYDCTNLDKLIIEKGLERIEARAFCGCTNLSELIYFGTVAEWNNISLDDVVFAGSYVRRIVCVDGVIDVVK